MQALQRPAQGRPSSETRDATSGPDAALEVARRALDCAVSAARSGEPPVECPRASREAFRALPRGEVRARLDALLLARHADVGLQPLLDSGFVGALFPELEAIVGFGDGESHKDVWRHTKQVVIQSVPRLAVRWSALLHDIGKPRTRSVGAGGVVHFFHHAEEGARMFDRLERRLGLFADDAELASAIRFLVLHHQRAHQYEETWTDSAVRRFARDVGSFLDDLMALSRADMTTKRRDKRRRFLFQLKDLQERIAKLAEADARLPLLPKGLGDELMRAFGLPPSRRIGDLRRQLEQLVEAGEIAPRQDAAVYVEFMRQHADRFGLV
jgi:poly(A) polymerase